MRRRRPAPGVRPRGRFAELERGGFRDESARARVVVFRTWLRHYPWAPAELVEHWSRVA